ncbi:hypothetical protein [Candidatus Methylacidiphilum infernorum]|uniref:Uncharacterized protein n=1 Tax=Methylacidiphilum infernorum (isolate V4) TaxID=481448 RepID=B3DWP0_METI4|nr:hypothetical protein [Candidatus Methylacidiphilum infernorum]ACD83703.1 Conserved hypothetical protein [Methylacidiphilum infernorum V4]
MNVLPSTFNSPHSGSGEPFRFIDEKDLDQWAATIECRGKLAELITRLIYAEKGPEAELRFPSGEASELKGLDGLCKVQVGTIYVPGGVSVWELSTQKTIRDKANEDFEKRTRQPGSINPQESTFVFVTPCLWSKKEDWVAEKKAGRTWADVRAYDAVDLVHWIERYPGVGLWLAESLGKPFSGLRLIEEEWKKWSSSTKWSISTDLVLAGRADEAIQIRKWLQGPPGDIALKAESVEEGIAFLYAVIDQLPVEYKMKHLGRCLIAAEPDQARKLEKSLSPLIIVIEKSTDPGLTDMLVMGGHHVCILRSMVGPIQNESKEISLPNALQHEMKLALLGMGLSEEETEKVARDTAGSLSVFRRLYPSRTGSIEPDWAKPENARKIIPAFLAGGWNADKERYEDYKQLERLTRKNYHELEGELTVMLAKSDFPLEKLNSTWKIASPRDAFSWLAPYITNEDLKVFEEVVVTVLGEPDPRYDMEADRRLVAPFTSRMPRYSEDLRQGLGEMILLLSIFSKETGLRDAELVVGRIVKRLLHGADTCRWWSMHSQLPLLAEADPYAFLSAIEESLKGENPPVLELFKDASIHLPIPSQVVHFLVSSLELLSWSPEYLAHASLLLARLAKLTQSQPFNGLDNNSPFKSLYSIFLPFYPQTYATLQQRLEDLDRLREKEPQVAWELMCCLLVLVGRYAQNQAYRPRWRDFSKKRSEERLTVLMFHDEITKRLLEEDMQKEPRLWILLFNTDSDFGSFSWLTPERRRKAVDLLSGSIPRLDDNVKEELWATIRNFLHYHRLCAGADWALPESELVQLEEIYNRLTPSDPLKQFSWLFTREPQVINPSSYDLQSNEESVETARREAVEKLVEYRGIDGLLDFAQKVEYPHGVGTAAAASNIEESQLLSLLSKTLGKGDKVACFGRGIVWFYARKNGIEWIERLIDHAKEKGWDKEAVLDVFLAAPPNIVLWNRLKALGRDLEEKYWKRVGLLNPEEIDNECFVIESLLSVGKGLNAAWIAGHCMRELPTDTLARIIDQSLIELNTPNPRISFRGLSQYILFILGRFLQELSRRSDANPKEVNQLAWSYCFFLSDPYVSASPFPILHERLNEDPEFFAELIKLGYSTSKTCGAQETEEEAKARKAKVQCAISLLNSWKGIPGTENGKINEEKVFQWIRKARELCKEDKRIAFFCDLHIGIMLARSPEEADGEWPTVAVRDAIEEFLNDAIEGGLISGKLGPSWRSPFEGGEQERKQASQYRKFADALRTSWPKTSKVLRRLAEFYEKMGESEDIEVRRRDLI